jgi:hypothetical protein
VEGAAGAIQVRSEGAEGAADVIQVLSRGAEGHRRRKAARGAGATE